jgi:mRNA interferase MazF
MIKEGQIVLFQFPLVDKPEAQLRPGLVIRKLRGHYNDWLLCMISSQVAQQVVDFDEVVDHEAKDWKQSGLKTPSVIKIARIAVVHQSILLGAIGEIEPRRLERIKRKLADWLLSK